MKMENILSVLVSHWMIFWPEVRAWALIGLVSVMTMIVFLQVVYRYVLAEPLHWSEEMARYLFVWLSLLGATLGLPEAGVISDLKSCTGSFHLETGYPEESSFIFWRISSVILLFQGISLGAEDSSAGISCHGNFHGLGLCLLFLWSSPHGSIHLVVIFFKDAAITPSSSRSVGRKKETGDGESPKPETLITRNALLWAFFSVWLLSSLIAVNVPIAFSMGLPRSSAFC